MFASYSGNTKIIKLLLENGADIDLVDANGMNPIDLTNMNNNRKTLKVLIECLAVLYNN